MDGRYRDEPPIIYISVKLPQFEGYSEADQDIVTDCATDIWGSLFKIFERYDKRISFTVKCSSLQ